MSKKNEVLTYEDYLKGVGRLKPEQQRNLLELLSTHLKKHSEKPEKKHKITELDGLGANIWEDVNVEEYIRQERESWD